MDPYTLDFKGFSDNSDLTLNGELGFEDFGSGDSFFTFNDFNISGLYNATFSGSVLDSNGALDGSVTPKGSSEEDFIRIIDWWLVWSKEGLLLVIQGTVLTRLCGYTMRYMPASVQVIAPPGRSTHAVYLARGRDLAGNEYGDPSRLFIKGIRWLSCPA